MGFDSSFNVVLLGFVVSVDEKEMARVHPAFITQMSGVFSVPDKKETPADKQPRQQPREPEQEPPPSLLDKSEEVQGKKERGRKHSRLEKTRGSLSLPRGEGLKLKSEDQPKEGSVEKSNEKEGGNKGTTTLRGLFARLKRDDDQESEEEDRELVIGSPMNVVHDAHIGRDNIDTDLEKVFPSPAPKKRPLTSLFSTLRSKKDLSAEKEEDADDSGGFVITGPTEVQHQGHVDVSEATKTDDVVAVVSDAIDSVKNKERPVDTDVFVEEIKFAEEYNPNL
jgi:hypothetical protein